LVEVSPPLTVVRPTKVWVDTPLGRINPSSTPADQHTVRLKRSSREYIFMRNTKEQMQRYIRALSADASVTEEHRPSREFWKRYDSKAIGCHGDPEKTRRLRTNFMETVGRLCGDEMDTLCTFWSDDTTLHFVPTRIDVERIREEQWASLLVMHRHETSTDPIEIIIDLRELTLSQFWKLSRRATYDQIVDGLRLWSTLPHKVKKVMIVGTKKNKIISRLCHTVANRVLSTKIRTRTVFMDDTVPS
jgi:hypothetical protein